MFLWDSIDIFVDDEMGVTNTSSRREGSKATSCRCCPMPMLFALGQLSALVAVKERMQENELKRSLVDVYVLPTRPFFTCCNKSCKRDSVATRKIQVWNRGSVKPDEKKNRFRRVGKDD